MLAKASGDYKHKATLLSDVLLCYRLSGMTVRHRYGPLVQRWRIYVNCKGDESILSECTSHEVYSHSRNVFISCNNTSMYLCLHERACKICGWKTGMQRKAIDLESYTSISQLMCCSPKYST